MKEISDELYQELEYLGIIDNSGVRNHNIGKSNYHTKLISPWVVWLSYPELTEFDKDIIKRILRTKEGDSRKMDYEKIIHVCQERIRQIDFEEKYKKLREHKQEFFEIKKGDKFKCIKTMFFTCNPHESIQADFEEGCFYMSYEDGTIKTNFGSNHQFAKRDWEEYFKRINE